MQPEVTLTISDELGQTRQVVIKSKRFTIGRTPENDLAIPNSNLSRRHAVIEAFEGVVQITDCGSQNGTEVNGTDVVAGAVLHDGDLITLAGVCDIWVAIVANGKRASQSSAGFAPESGSRIRQQTVLSRAQGAAPPLPLQTNTKIAVAAGGASGPSGLGVPLIAATAVAMVIAVAGGLLLVISRSNSPQRNRTDRSQVANQSDNQGVADQANAANSTPPGNEELSSVSNGPSAGAEQLEKAAMAVMRRISSDDKTYSFSDKALQEIGRKVSNYRRSASLAGNLQAIQRNSAALGALARQEGLEPGLLIYAVLAHTEGGRTDVDPVAVARGIISNLLALRATFGTNDADSSLIIIAAHRIGGGGKRSHPLLVTIRRLVRHPLTQRNVWYLNERGGLEAEVYDFVVSFMALAVIAQDPRQFGVASNPLVF
jgi:predicted component of type VI protein secretion system